MRLSVLCLSFGLLVGPIVQAQQLSGYKLVERHAIDQMTTEQTTYFAGDRERRETRVTIEREMPDGTLRTETLPPRAYITRCDTAQSYDLDLDTQEFESSPYPLKPFTPEQIAAMHVPQLGPAPANKTLRIEVTTVDTGERKDFFGHTARHVITTRKQIPLEGSHSSAQETVTDAWYIDLDSLPSCLPKPIKGGQYFAYATMSDGNAPPENPEFVAIGTSETGFAVQRTDTTSSTITLSNGATRRSDLKLEAEVTEFQEGPLDPGLFEVPSEFKHVDHFQADIPPVSPQKAPGVWDQFWSEVANRLGGKK